MDLSACLWRIASRQNRGRVARSFGGLSTTIVVRLAPTTGHLLLSFSAPTSCEPPTSLLRGIRSMERRRTLDAAHPVIPKDREFNGSLQQVRLRRTGPPRPTDCRSAPWGPPPWPLRVAPSSPSREGRSKGVGDGVNARGERCRHRIAPGILVPRRSRTR
jgi:hypothetical protein